jgi:hypothetical protein
LLIFWGCVKEPCLNIPELDKQTAQTKEWFVNDSIGNQKITDENGISQTLIVSSLYSGFHENIVEDDCGNTYGSFDFSIQYNTSLSPLNFMIDIHGSGLLEDSFYLTMTITNTNTVEHKSTTYDFVTETCRENNATIVFIEQIHILNKVYDDVLKISFNNTFSTNDVKTVYYSKGYGIIKFVKENGNKFEIN